MSSISSAGGAHVLSGTFSPTVNLTDKSILKSKRKFSSLFNTYLQSQKKCTALLFLRGADVSAQDFPPGCHATPFGL